MKSIIIYSLALVALASCSKSEEIATTPTNPDTPIAPKEIRISAAIEASAQTKTNTTVTGPIDGTTEITGIQFLRKDANPSELVEGALSFDGISAIGGKRATSTSGGNITFDGSAPTYDQTENKNAYFVAYYPAGTVANNVATLDIDGKTDILYAPLFNAGTYTATITSGSVMNFKHALAQLEVVCMAEENISGDVMKEVWGKINKIEISTLAKAQYKYSDQSFEFKDAANGTTAANMALLQKDYKTAFSAIDVPTYVGTPSSNDVVAAGMFAPAAENNTDAITLTITTQVADQSEVTTQVTVQLKDGDPSSNKGFERGKKHTAILTFKTSTKEISVTGTTIAPWNTGYTGSVDINPSASPAE